MAAAATAETVLLAHADLTSCDFDLVARPERRGSFDVLASVQMFRYDLEHYEDVIQPETYARVCDEELSLIAEGVDRAACTEFPLKRSSDGDDLMYFKGGKRHSYTGMLLVGQQVARDEAVADPRREFLADEATDHLHHLYQMRKLKPGEQHVWHSPYRKDIEQKYGKRFMSADCGRFPERQMAFIYRAYCNQEGDVVLESQTVDRSNDRAFAAVLAYAQENKAATMSEHVDVYDDVLAREYGGQFYAGRRDAELHENAWQTIREQRDLVEYFLTRLEAIARTPLYGRELEEAVKKHMYGVWGAFKQRIDGGTTAPAVQIRAGGIPAAYYVMVEQEVQRAYTKFATEGRPMIGCGGSITMLQGEKDILNADVEDVYDAIFGKSKAGEDDRGPLVFKCKYGHVNRRKKDEPLREECCVAICPKGSVGCGPKK